LHDFGSYRVGGRLVHVQGQAVRRVAFTETMHHDVDPNGTYCVESAYVQYFVPARRNTHPPMVLLHGGGLSGAMWETTPDGRRGWLHRLLAQGYEVHVMDNVERGRAGWWPHAWPDTPMLRTLEDAWSLFRFGAPQDFSARRPYPGQQFPVDHLDALGFSFVPRWISTTPYQCDALCALLQTLGRVLLLCHSQGGEVGLQAAARLPGCVAHVLLVEPSGFTRQTASLRDVPVTIAYGDFLTCTQTWRTLREQWEAFAHALRAHGGRAELLDLTKAAPGASHMPMMDMASDAYLDLLLTRLGEPPRLPPGRSSAATSARIGVRKIGNSPPGFRDERA